MTNLMKKLRERSEDKRGTSEEVVAEAAGALMDRLAEMSSKVTPESLTEMRRICSLPIIWPLTDDEVEAVNFQHVKAEHYDQGWRLKRVQAEALMTYEEMGTVFGPIEVGAGKTLITLRIAGMAAEKGYRKIMLIVPPQLIAQLESVDINWAREHVPIGLRFHSLAGKSRADRLALVANVQRGCFLTPSSLLSTADSHEMLELACPDLILIDEAHQFKNKRSARTRRLNTFIKEHNPDVCAVSGTMTSKSIRDYAHILQWCLGHDTPLPLDTQVVADWAAMLDATVDYSEKRAGTGPLRPLIKWSRENFPEDKIPYNVEGFRRAYQNRLLTTPGVVSSPADSLGCSLVFDNTPATFKGCEGAEELQKHFKKINEEWVAPNGDEIEWAMHKFKWEYELSAGIFNNLFWPEPEIVAKRHGHSHEQAVQILERSKSHHIARQNYNIELRNWLKYHQIPGVDTPMLVGNEMARHGDATVGKKLYKAWRRAKDLEFPEMLDRDSSVVRVCDYKIREAIRWMKQRKEGVIWYLSKGVGEWLYERALEEGLPVKFFPAGNKSNVALTAADAAEKMAGHFLICTGHAHSTGKNMQYMNEQLCVQFPRSEETCQQLIGRQHRTGQQSDEVFTTTMITTQVDEISLAATLSDGIYVFETTSSPRKVLIGTWNPMPVIYGERMLERAGAQAKKLNVRQRKMLEERFGSNKVA